MAPAPAATQATASRASSAADSGRAGWSDLVVTPFSAACSIRRSPYSGRVRRQRTQMSVGTVQREARSRLSKCSSHERAVLPVQATAAEPFFQESLHRLRLADERIDLVQFGFGDAAPHRGRRLVLLGPLEELAHLRDRETRAPGNLHGGEAIQ